MFTATRTQVATYLLGVCLFSISFLVFLNASISFVVTDIIGQGKGIGNAVGTLGFADELVAIFACPFWGILSDRIGVQKVSAIGYGIVGLALFIFVQAKNVYPGLLLARMFFSIGGAACTTMVTAVLPAVTSPPASDPDDHAGRQSAPSVSSELTITPARAQRERDFVKKPASSSPTRVAGIVGTFTGCGALIALLVFLPLPTRFKNQHISDAQALKDTFYVVGAIAFVVALLCFIGLRRLRGEQHKTLRSAWATSNHHDSVSSGKRILPYGHLFYRSLRAGTVDYRIGLGYLGGFVARASSVGISLFIPLAVNTYFISSGRCKVDPSDPAAIKSQCKEAYVLSSQLTGVSQLVALLSAPLFGYLADKYRRFELPLLFAALAGIIGYVGFSTLESPEPSGERGSPLVFVVVCLLGISQIGAIVCSLGLLGRGISGLAEPNDRPHDTSSVDDVTNEDSATPSERESAQIDSTNESSHLLPPLTKQGSEPLIDLKGSIAGTYSFIGGAGILILTKLGGFLFDHRTPAAPFIIMASFNVLLLIGGVGSGVYRHVGRHKSG